jgi:uncharacterized protein (TIGR02646 family)
MIRIHRPPVVPEGLAGGPPLVADACALHDGDPDLFATSKGKFDFDGSVYGCETVRSSLKGAQFYKCCYCESRVEHVSYGEIEHFRPKAAWRQERRSQLTRPGYYWLAYAWENLLWSCKACNGRHKGILFPLEDPAARDCAGRSIEAEAPLLVDPTRMDPRDHIRFKLEEAIPLTRCGEITIEVLALNREGLREERRGHLARLVAQWNNIQTARELGGEALVRAYVLDALRSVGHAVHPRAPYSSMAIDLIADLEATVA